MNQDLEEALVKNYPSIFKDIYGDPKETCMSFGIETGTGWYNLIESACFNIQETVDLVNHIHPNLNFRVVAAQIKQKWGTLRFYIEFHYNPDVVKSIEGVFFVEGASIEWAFDRIHETIRFAEKKSEYICDTCGDWMKYDKGEGWHYPKCEACCEERMRELEEKAHLRRLPLSDTSDTIDGGAKP